ncbi:MAG: LytTR family DNA-binding domain-containing protein [Clostridia bacterium]|nr:LytTR family DNA-binding domain-containing protein [Clostridia bacterium]
MQIKLITDCDIPEVEITVRCREADAEIASLMAMLRMQDRKLTGEKDGALHILNPRDILYADTVDNKVFLYAAKDVYETPLKLYEIEERLRAHSFVRASKSQVVNFNRVESVRPDFNGRLSLTMQNGEKLLVSRQYAIQIKKMLEVN